MATIAALGGNVTPLHSALRVDGAPCVCLCGRRAQAEALSRVRLVVATSHITFDPAKGHIKLGQVRSSSTGAKPRGVPARLRLPSMPVPGNLPFQLSPHRVVASCTTAKLCHWVLRCLPAGCLHVLNTGSVCCLQIRTLLQTAASLAAHPPVEQVGPCNPGHKPAPACMLTAELRISNPTRPCWFSFVLNSSRLVHILCAGR